MSKPGGKFGSAFDALTKARQEPAPDPEPRKPANGETGKPASEAQPDVRGKYTTILPRALVKEVQRYAFDHDLKDYAVVEQALREFLDRHR